MVRSIAQCKRGKLYLDGSRVGGGARLDHEFWWIGLPQRGPGTILDRRYGLALFGQLVLEGGTISGGVITSAGIAFLGMAGH